jgi:hypothetical protein
MATVSGTASFTSTTGPAQGGGWTGALSAGGQVGSSGAAGYAENVIGRPAFVPYQLLAGSFVVEVVAEHIEGIAYVDFYVDQGPKKRVSSATTSTGAVSGLTCEIYQTTLHASDYTDGRHEWRAIVYPVNGQPITIAGGFFTANSGGTIPVVTKYISPSGSDSTGAGTSGNPYKTMNKAAAAIHAVNGGFADHGIVKMKAGEYDWGGSLANGATTTYGWITFQPDDGLTAADVSITHSAVDSYAQVEFVRLKNLTLTNDVQLYVGFAGAAIWLDGGRAVGAGYDTSAVGIGNSITGWRGVTDYTVSGMVNFVVGLGFHLGRGLTIHDMGEDGFRDYQCLIDALAYNIQESPSAHPDIIQYATPSNVIIMAVKGITNISTAQGFSTNGNTRDLALVNNVLRVTSNPLTMLQMEFAWRHVLVKGGTYYGGTLSGTGTGGSQFRIVEGGKEFTATNVVFDSVSFPEEGTGFPTCDDASSSPPSGVTIR